MADGGAALLDQAIDGILAQGLIRNDGFPPLRTVRNIKPDRIPLAWSQAQPELKCDHWERHRNRQQAVFTFFVPQTRSEYNLFFCCYKQPGIGDMQQSYKAAIRGLIYADPLSGEIRRLVIMATDMPLHFHINKNNTITYYDKISIAGRAYNLPVAAVVFAQARLQCNRNKIALVDYRKCEADSVLTDVHSKITYFQ